MEGDDDEVENAAQPAGVDRIPVERGAVVRVIDVHRGKIELARITEQMPEVFDRVLARRMRKLVGEGRALEMIMTGRTVTAPEAERIGLVNRIVEGDPVLAGVAFAREFTCYSLPVLRLAREAVTRAGDTPVAEGLRIELDLTAQAFATADSAEGAQAFLDKRKPVFKDA